MNKLIHAVGIVLEKKRYTGLTVANVSNTLGVDRKLISVYFGTIENLVETYIKGRLLDFSLCRSSGNANGHLIAKNRIYVSCYVSRERLSSLFFPFSDKEFEGKILILEVFQFTCCGYLLPHPSL